MINRESPQASNEGMEGFGRRKKNREKKKEKKEKTAIHKTRKPLLPERLILFCSTCGGPSDCLLLLPP